MLCNKPATVHLTEIVEGKKVERHFCEMCAQKEGITTKSHIPINELLGDLVKSKKYSDELSELTCPQCNMTWKEFRKHSLLGCPNDYEVFAEPLKKIIENAHEGFTTHRGRVPAHCNSPMSRQVTLMRLRQQLQRALEDEDYETAAQLRDELQRT